jgi:hypothetical protein
MTFGLIGALLTAPVVSAGSVTTIRIDVTLGGAETFTATPGPCPPSNGPFRVEMLIAHD